MNVVVSIGGSVLAPGDKQRVRDHAAVLEEVADECTTAAVVGGGETARQYIDVARKLGANEMELDEIGIAATRLNARLLVAALDEQSVRTPPADYEAAADVLRAGDIAVMGGVVPAQTTDAVAAALAEYVNADLLVYATSVSGVYTADPDKDGDAERVPRLTPNELVDLIADIEMTAGAKAPVDLLAAKVLQRSGLHAVVVDGTDPERIREAIVEGTHRGTEIVPEDAAELPSLTGGGT
ncbi:MAG: UMP kinase [Salinarchaeum sp.]